LRQIVNVLVRMLGTAEDGAFKVGVKWAEQGVVLSVGNGSRGASLMPTIVPSEALQQFVTEQWPPAEAELFRSGR
jgi:hypothetical protein